MTSYLHHQSSGEINPVHQLMTITSCSCSKCNSIACFTKRQPCQLNTYDAKAPRSYSFIDSISHSFTDALVKKKENEKETFAEEYNKNIISDKETHINPEKIKKQSQISFKINSKEQINEAQNNDLTNEFPSDTATNSYDLQVSSTTAKLSAQIMNVPYHTYEDSVQTLHKPEAQPITLPKMSVFEILEKIKEVYNACSCKVCECLGGKSQINEFCKCKPCDCNECRGSQKKITLRSGQQIPHSRCLWPKCMYVDGDLCKVITKYGSMPNCNCTQCECVHCADSMPEPCSCNLCQCIECEGHKFHKPLSHKELIVAAVGDDNDNQTHRCQCSPCQCAECSHSVATDLLRREMSTEVNRHQRCRCETCVNEACLPDDNDTCRCERRDKLMRKPVQSNNTDYDIRRAVITQRINTIDKDRRDILMFASITNRYSTCCFDEKHCSCDQCQSIKCNSDDNTANYVKSSRVKRRLPTMNTTINDGTCDCNVCDCLNCEKLLKPFKDLNKTKAFNGSKMCPSGCAEYDIKKNMLRANNIRDGVKYKCKRSVGKSNFFEFLNPIKILTPASFEDKMHHSDIKIKQIENNFDVLAMKSSPIPSSRDKINDNDLINFANNRKESCEKLNKKTKVTKLVNPSNIIPKRANIFQKTMNFQEPWSIKSSKSSLYYSNIGRISSKSDNMNKSKESSCNSSGHDFSDYLVQFPKRNVEICRDDATKLIKGSDLILNALNVTPKDCSVQKQSSILPNFIDNEYKKGIFYDEQNIQPRSKRKTYSVNNDEVAFVVNHQLPTATSVADQCSFSKEPKVISSTIQTDNENGRAHKVKSDEIDHSIKSNDYSFKEAGKEIICKDEKSFITMNNETIEEDYKRVQKTLEDFSQELLHMLAKYEMANREFKSITEEFQYPEEPQIFSIDKKPKISSSNNVNEDLIKTDSTEMVANERNKNVVYTYDVQENAGDKIEIKVKPKQFSSILKYKTNTILSGENVCHIIENSNNEPITADANGGSSTNNLNSYLTEHSEISLVDDSIKQNSKVEGIEPSSDLIDSQIKRRIKGKVSKKYEQPSSIFVPKDLVLQVTDNENRCNDLVTLNANKQSEIKGTVVDGSVSDADDNLTSSAKKETVVPNTILGQQNVLEAFNMKTPQKEAVHVKCAVETKPWPILKKTYIVKANPMSVTKGFRQPSEVETKEATKTISWDHEVKQENKTLVNVHSVKNPLEKPLLQRIEDVLGKINSEEAKSHKNSYIFEPKDSCESLKVRSLSVQRVSDHTVMVKWTAPRDLNNIRGYEMLIDGRPMQKVFHSSSSVAVVTCLPNSKSMLLTVRTVTRSPCASGHCPSTTVVYKPRNKNKQD